jgi:NADH-quinone oxidoreductase subunit H
LGFCGIHLVPDCGQCRIESFSTIYPEGESELIAGYFTEYSGFKFALFFLLPNTLSLFAISGLGITLFLGG